MKIIFFKKVLLSDGDKKYSTRNIVNRILITMHASRWVLKYWGEHLVKYLSNRYAAHMRLIRNNIACKM